MQPKTRVSLCAAIIAVFLSGSVCHSVLAQETEPELLHVGPMVMNAGALEHIDADAKAVFIRQNNFPFQRASQPNLLVKVPIAPGAIIERLEPAILARDLKIGDVVSVLGNRVWPSEMRRGGTLNAPDGVRYYSRAFYLQVVSLAPLTLQREAGPTSPAEAEALPRSIRKSMAPWKNEREDVIKAPFIHSPGATPTGTFSVIKTAPDAASSLLTLTLTRPEMLAFERLMPISLSDAAAQFEAGQAEVKPWFSESSDRKLQIAQLELVVKK